MKYQAKLLLVGALMVFLAATAAFADDPPGRVARLEFMSGSVSVQPRGVDDWVAGSANRPLTNADNIWADKDSRAELNVGTGLLRINSESSLTLTNINNDVVQVELHQGALNVHVGKLYGGEVYEIDSPNLAFTVKKSGDYRFDVDPNGDATTVTVWKGEGEATGQGSAVKVHSGEQARFTGGTSLAHETNPAPPPDSFDDWCRVRDQREEHSVSAQYVAPGTVGSEDLDDSGTWRKDSEYGNVWTPNDVGPDWAPYRDGQWIWVDPWGWTWQDDASWGFAPFHYGRWVYTGGYWGWAPGPYWVRPWYAPALVGWFGGPRWGVGFGFGFGGGWGWCPLGWGEPFFPWWGGVSRGYFRNVNISNTRITNINHITNNYYNNNGANRGLYGQHGIASMPRYATTHNGLTTASANTMQHSLPVARNMVKVPESALHNLASARGPSVSPTVASRLGPTADRPTARPASAAASRPTVSRMTPPASPARVGSSAGARGNPGTRGAEPSRAGNVPSSASPRGSETHGPQSATAGNRPNAQTPASGGRYVPRPPQSMTPRTPATGEIGSGARAGQPSRPEANQTAMSRNVPRPPEGSSRATESAPRSYSAPTNAPRSYSAPSAGRSGGYSVPRPSGTVRPAPRDYGWEGNSRRSYGGSGGGLNPYRGYGERPTYSSPRGGGGSYGHYSAPSHSSGGYGGSHGSSSGGSHGSSGSHGGGGGSHGGGHR